MRYWWFHVSIHIEPIASQLGLYHLSMLDPAYENYFKRSCLAFSSFVWGLQNPSHVIHIVSIEISLGSRYYAWYIFSPLSPDHLKSFLHFLLSGNLVSSTSRIFLHFNFKILSLKYIESSTDQSMAWPSMNWKVRWFILVVSCLLAFGGFWSCVAWCSWYKAQACRIPGNIQSNT